MDPFFDSVSNFVIPVFAHKYAYQLFDKCRYYGILGGILPYRGMYVTSH